MAKTGLKAGKLGVTRGMTKRVPGDTCMADAKGCSRSFPSLHRAADAVSSTVAVSIPARAASRASSLSRLVIRLTTVNHDQSPYCGPCQGLVSGILGGGRGGWPGEPGRQRATEKPARRAYPPMLQTRQARFEFHHAGTSAATLRSKLISALPATASATTVSPAWKSPLSSRKASGSCTSRWMALRIGRAP